MITIVRPGFPTRADGERGCTMRHRGCARTSARHQFNAKIGESVPMDEVESGLTGTEGSTKTERYGGHKERQTLEVCGRYCPPHPLESSCCLRVLRIAPVSVRDPRAPRGLSQMQLPLARDGSGTRSGVFEGMAGHYRAVRTIGMGRKRRRGESATVTNPKRA